MESMRDVDRVMEREIKKGSTPLKFEQLGFGDYSYNEITSKEKLLQVYHICPLSITLHIHNIINKIINVCEFILPP